MKIKRYQSVTEFVSQYLEDKIISGELKPGERLTTRETSQQLGISAIPVREAFRILEGAGLVKFSPRKGIRVSDFTKHEIEEIFTLRAYLFGLTAKLASRNLKDRDLAEIVRLGEELAQKCQKGDIKSYFQVNIKFYRLLAKASNNNKLCHTLENLAKQTYRYCYASLSIPGRLQKSLLHHKHIIQALKERDEEKAEKSAKLLLEEAGQALISHLYGNSLEFHASHKDILQDVAENRRVKKLTGPKMQILNGPR